MQGLVHSSARVLANKKKSGTNRHAKAFAGRGDGWRRGIIRQGEDADVDEANINNDVDDAAAHLMDADSAQESVQTGSRRVSRRTVASRVAPSSKAAAALAASIAAAQATPGAGLLIPTTNSLTPVWYAVQSVQADSSVYFTWLPLILALVLITLAVISLLSSMNDRCQFIDRRLRYDTFEAGHPSVNDENDLLQDSLYPDQDDPYNPLNTDTSTHQTRVQATWDGEERRYVLAPGQSED